VLVESHMGRPTKIEPNPDHPATLGGTDVFAQASILTLYDPDRARAVLNGDDIVPYGRFLQVLQGAMNAQRALKGAGLRLLTETVISPTLHDQIAELLRELPEAATTCTRAPGWRSASRSSRNTRLRTPTSCSRSTPTSCSSGRAASAGRATSSTGAASPAARRG
jgi:hypothetical protein